MRSVLGDIVAREAYVMKRALTPQEIELFEGYAAELKKWNSKVNLTAITKDAEIAIKHFVDSLAVFPFLAADDTLLDIGSGAGLPVIPLKIVLSDIPMISVDAVAKKYIFSVMLSGV